MRSSSSKDTDEPSRGMSVSLQDVLEANPAEDEAETRMMRSIEQGEDVGGSYSAGILDNVPEETNVFSSTHKPESIEDDLAALTNQIKGTTPEWSGDSNDSSKPGEKQEKDKRDNNTQADFFVRNAQSLMRKARVANRSAEKGSEYTYEEFKSFLAFRKESIFVYARSVILHFIIPFTGLACLLFYGLDNPGGDNDEDDASASWWVLFVFVRQVITLALAKGAEALIIDFFCVGTRIAMHLIGPFFTLMLVQSKGWPFQLLAWGGIDFCVLYGNSDFARHWLFYQDAIDVFNGENKAGRVLEAGVYRDLLICFVLIGGVVGAKRFFMALWYGQGVYRRYGKELSIVLKKAILISKVAALARNPNALSEQPVKQSFAVDCPNVRKASDTGDGEDKDDFDATSSKLLIDTNETDSAGALTVSQKMKIQDLLGEWEEPATDERKTEATSISAIVQFRAALSTIDEDYPFTLAFGKADKREKCIECSQQLFLRLLKSGPDSEEALNFNMIAQVALKQDGTINETMLKSLIELFRPTRDGKLTMLDFLKSIDSVYKDIRVVRASVRNANKMNAASQAILNVAFYFILSCFVLGIIGIDPVALFGALTAFIVGFAFMIGGASSKYFEGLLLVLVRKPFDIGDRIAVSGVESETSASGSSGWIVKDLTLFHTTVIFGTTGEEATYSNGSLANSRIINHNRSPKAVLSFIARFGIEVSQEKVKAFGDAVAQYVKKRPREWLVFSAFRLADVVPDQGYVEYKVIMQHREGWQQIGALLTSKADVQLFAYELSKKMDMGYENPPMPVILSKRSSTGDNDGDNVSIVDSAMGKNST